MGRGAAAHTAESLPPRLWRRKYVWDVEVNAQKQTSSVAPSDQPRTQRMLAIQLNSRFVCATCLSE